MRAAQRIVPEKDRERGVRTVKQYVPVASFFHGLTDVELAKAQIRIDDPALLVGMTREKSDPALSPLLVGEYHLPPPDALSSEPSPLQWCCHCQRHTHQHGYVITDSTERRYTIGSTCGPKHYALGGFEQAKSSFDRSLARQIAVRSIFAFREAMPSIVRECQEVLHSPALRYLGAKQNEIKAAAPDFWNALQSRLSLDGQLFAYDKVRDRDAETRREERHERDDLAFRSHPPVNEPIFKEVKVDIGAIKGASLVRERGDLRDHALGLERAISENGKFWVGSTDEHLTSAMTAALKTIRVAARQLVDSIEETRGAPSFFDVDNLTRVCQWATKGLRLRREISVRGNTLIISADRIGEVPVRLLPPLEFPPVPAIRSLLS